MTSGNTAARPRHHHRHREWGFPLARGGLFLLLLLTSCSQATTPTPVSESTTEPPAPSFSPTSEALPPRVTAESAQGHVQHLSVTVGSRPTGTPKEVAAADYIASEFRRYGYTVDRQAFNFEVYRARSASLEVTGPPSERQPARPIEYSPAGEATGSLVAAGLGRPSDFPRPAAGGIALIERGTLQFQEKVANAATAGAGGVIVYNNEPGAFGDWAMSRVAPIPAVAVSRETGQQLLQRLSQGEVQVRISVDARHGKTESENVIARAGPGCRAVVGGHYDSVEAGPGANDNASGTAVVLEVARVLKARGKADGVCLMAFGGEELGLWGSRRYVESLSEDEKRTMVAMVNLDMVGVGDVWRLSGSEELRDKALDAAQSEGVPIASFSSEDRRGGSDHASFISAGIPAVFIHRRDDPNYHTAEDKAEFVDPAALETAGRLALAILDRLLPRP